MQLLLGKLDLILQKFLIIPNTQFVIDNSQFIINSYQVFSTQRLEIIKKKCFYDKPTALTPQTIQLPYRRSVLFVP